MIQAFGGRGVCGTRAVFEGLLPEAGAAVEVEAVSDAETRASGSKNISASKLESPSVRHGDEGVV